MYGAFRRGRPENVRRRGGLASVSLASTTVVRATSRTVEDSPGHLITVGANLPAVGYLGLSVELAHTNLFLRSEEFDNASWIKSTVGAAGAPTISANAGTAPDGSLTADKIDIPAVGASQASQCYQIVTGTAAAYTFSVWAKAVTPGSATYIFLINDTTGTMVGQTLIQPSTTEWTRYSVTGTLTAATYAIVIGVRVGLTGSTQLAQAASSVLYWGAQIELGDYAHSYVATTSASATCNADVVTSSFATLPTATGEVAVTFTPLWSTAAGNEIYDTRATVGSSGTAMYIQSGILNFVTRSAISQTTTPSSVLTWVGGQTYALRATWGAGNVYVYRDGVLVGSLTDGSAYMPNANTAFRIGAAFTDGFQADGYIASIAFSRP